MKVNRKNYESHFLDYWENNLQPEMVAELMVFLEDNPDLKDEFDEFENVVLVPDENIKFQTKGKLKKKELVSVGEIQSENYKQYMVGVLEGDLTKQESVDFKIFLNINPHLKLEYNLLKSTFLFPDKKIVFKNKDSLKKAGLFLLYKTQILYGLSIAATIIIFLGFYFGNNFQNRTERYSEKISKMEIVKPEIYEKEIAKIVYRYGYESEKAVENLYESHAIYPSESRSVNITKITKKNASDIIIASDNIFQEKYIKTRMTENDFSGKIPVYAYLDTGANEKQKSKSFVGRFVTGLTNKFVNTKDLEKKSFIEYTVEGYNLIADKEVTVNKELDENGKVVAYNVNGESISFARFRKNSSQE